MRVGVGICLVADSGLTSGEVSRARSSGAGSPQAAKTKVNSLGSKMLIPRQHSRTLGSLTAILGFPRPNPSVVDLVTLECLRKFVVKWLCWC